jgi:hypothetical protein
VNGRISAINHGHPAAEIRQKSLRQLKGDLVRRFYGVCLVAACLIAPTAARADQFSFSFHDTTTGGTVITASGLFDATLLSLGQYRITAIVGGLQNGSAMTLLPTNGSPSCCDPDAPSDPGYWAFGNFHYDNLLYVPPAAGWGTAGNPRYLDYHGLGYTVAGGGWNLWGDPNTAAAYIDYNGTSTQVDLSVSAVPDGGVTLMLLGGVLVGLDTLRRRVRL